METYLGTIMAFAFNFTPTNWLPCNGQLLAIAQYQALFSLLGTYYGGDGVRTFALPNLQGRMPVGQGNGPGLPPVTMGEVGGAASVTLNVANLPAHAHAVAPPVSTSAATATSPGGAVPATTAATLSGGTGRESVTVNSYAASGTQTGATFNTGSAGGSTPVSTMPPFVGVNYCICFQGIFPSRS